MRKRNSVCFHYIARLISTAKDYEITWIDFHEFTEHNDSKDFVDQFDAKEIYLSTNNSPDVEDGFRLD